MHETVATKGQYRKEFFILNSPEIYRKTKEAVKDFPAASNITVVAVNAVSPIRKPMSLSPKMRSLHPLLRPRREVNHGMDPNGQGNGGGTDDSGSDDDREDNMPGYVEPEDGREGRPTLPAYENATFQTAHAVNLQINNLNVSHRDNRITATSLVSISASSIDELSTEIIRVIDTTCGSHETAMACNWGSGPFAAGLTISQAVQFPSWFINVGVPGDTRIDGFGSGVTRQVLSSAVGKACQRLGQSWVEPTHGERYGTLSGLRSNRFASTARRTECFTLGVIRALCLVIGEIPPLPVSPALIVAAVC
ncbi:hypothetical protein CC2G_013538 [Coprinopsis cinerea AmutBmut pab1-1]|nr:hypothetical protein CC2G_013538 [Coprinopsis cinerea AmutBmut pab1-1]